MMRQNGSNLLLFIGLSVVAAGLFWAGEKYLFPPKPKPPAPPKRLTSAHEPVGGLGGGLALGGLPFETAPRFVEAKPVEPPKPAAVKPSEPRALIALGDESFFLKVLLTNKGGGVQQVMLTQFKDASRLGLEIKDNGASRHLVLIPGYVRPWKPYVEYEPPFVDLQANYSAKDLATGAKPGKLSCEEALLTKPSYTMFHYPSRDDPLRPRATDDVPEIDVDKYPLATLGEKEWTVASIEQPKDAPWRVVFETTLDAPYFLKIRKTFSLAPRDYDFKLHIDIEPLPGRAKGVGQFRYQIAGPLNMPIEGEWYSATFRTVYTGWTDAEGKERRAVDDPKSIHYNAGADRKGRLGTFHYAAVSTQFFTSALAVVGGYNKDDQPWEYVRATREFTPADAKINQEVYDPEKAFLYDVTFRAVTPLFDPAPGDAIHHTYAIYNGPVKVRLLGDLEGARAVSPDLVSDYLNNYHLATLTDFHSPNWFGRQADAIYWADLVIAATNLMHSLLGWLHGLTGDCGVSIVLLTMLVKLCLIIPSRHQQAINANMQAKIATIKPQLDEVSAKYRDDFMTLSQEKAKLFKKAGIRHSAQFGGCLLLFLQMPILMGLYYSLQENVIFRLDSFLWIPNLAAPDMLAWWSEHIPLISTPDNRFGFFSFLYLGPFFSILPIGAVLLFYVQQKLTMPPPTDEMQEQQQKMMKYMLIFSALFFYKVAAGLCLYFIVSGLWSIMERQLIPKPKAKEIIPGDEEPLEKRLPRTMLGRWLRRKAEEYQEIMKELQKQAQTQRQIRNDPKPLQDDAMTRNERRTSKKKKR